jgi:hypothetical protein|tara:strand:- start:69 stop:1631 length:1563 start_codon:yes stop_codon:yes gene_type:complete
MVALSELENIVKQSDPNNKAQKYLNKYESDENTFFQALTNIPSSARQFGNDIIQPFIHPVKTAKSIKELSKSVVAYATGDQENDKLAKEVGNFFVQRYGSLENIKKTFSTDPVGILSDVSILFTGGGMAAAKAPSYVGKVGSAIKSVGSAIDPINVASKTIKTASDLSKKANITPITSTFGLTTGAGGKAVQEAVEAGIEGGGRGEAFRDNLRGVESAENVVTGALDNMKTMQTETKTSYKKGIDNLKLSEKKVNFENVMDGVDVFIDSKLYKGELLLSKDGKIKLKKIQEILTDWQNKPHLHDIKGLDALKKLVDAEYPTGIKVGDSGIIVTQIRNTIKDQIIKQVPEYAKVMKAYEEAITLESKIIKELSMGNKIGAGTILRKLQSVMRNNVNTNFGQRLDYVKLLDEAGMDKYLMAKLAGQSLSSPFPRGLQGLTAGSQVGLGTYGAASGAVNPLYLIPSLMSQSPRLVGEVAHGIGGAGNIANKLVKPIATTGSIARPTGILQQQKESLNKRGLLQ